MVKNTSIFTDSMLVIIANVSSKLECTQVFVSPYLLAFFSFFHLSNIVANSFKGFDVSRNLAKEDLSFSESLAIILVK